MIVNYTIVAAVYKEKGRARRPAEIVIKRSGPLQSAKMTVTGELDIVEKLTPARREAFFAANPSWEAVPDRDAVQKDLRLQ